METSFDSDDSLGVASGIDALAAGHDDLSDPGNYTDETTLGDDTYETSSNDETITLDYAGDEQQYTANEDLDGDGTNETAVVDQSDGSQMVLTDSDGDGEADRAKLLDVEGNLVDAKHVDADGEWVRDDVAGADSKTPADAISVNPDHDPTAEPTDAPVDVPEGQVYADLGSGGGVAEATVDLDRDGTEDTAVLQSTDGSGSQLLVVDTDDDGVADMAGEYDSSGDLVATYHPDDEGVMTKDAEIDRSDGDSDTSTYSVDPDTGKWIGSGS